MEFVRDNPGEPIPEETFTHSHPSWSSIIPICFLHLLRSMSSSVFNPRALQSFFTISLQVFFGLPLELVPSTSYDNLTINGEIFCKWGRWCGRTEAAKEFIEKPASSRRAVPPRVRLSVVEDDIGPFTHARRGSLVGVAHRKQHAGTGARLSRQRSHSLTGRISTDDFIRSYARPFTSLRQNCEPNQIKSNLFAQIYHINIGSSKSVHEQGQQGWKQH